MCILCNKELYNQLDEAIWITKGTRFLTYRKYKSIFNILKFFNTLFAFILIVIAIYQMGGLKFQEGVYDKHINIILLILSIYIFSVSFYLSVLELKVKTIHDNATNLSSLLRKLKLVSNDQELDTISIKYNRLEKELNHDQIDYKQWCNQVNNVKYKNSLCGKIYYFLLWQIYSKFPILIFVIGLVILLKFL